MRMFSKYIRLKDGTICDDIEKYLLDEEGNYCEFRTFMGINEEVIIIPKDNIEKESDNLDDLVDAYVAVLRKNKDYEKDEYRVIGTRYLPGIKKDYVDKGYSVYGAIWNTLELKFVTYMDKDGKLKLL